MAARLDVSKLWGLFFLSCFLVLPTVCFAQTSTTEKTTGKESTTPQGGQQKATSAPTTTESGQITTVPAVPVNNNSSALNVTSPPEPVVPTESDLNTTAATSNENPADATVTPTPVPATNATSTTPEAESTTENKTEQAPPQGSSVAPSSTVNVPLSTTTKYVSTVKTEKSTPQKTSLPPTPSMRTKPVAETTTQVMPPAETTIQGTVDHTSNTTEGKGHKIPQYHDNETLSPVLAFFIAVLVILVVIALVVTIWWKQRRANFQTIGGDLPMSWFSRSGKKGFELLDDSEPMLNAMPNMPNPFKKKDDVEEYHLIGNTR